jgi:hypothetical protein
MNCSRADRIEGVAQRLHLGIQGRAIDAEFVIMTALIGADFANPRLIIADPLRPFGTGGVDRNIRLGQFRSVIESARIEVLVRQTGKRVADFMQG